jgi:hypothetical protein
MRIFRQRAGIQGPKKSGLESNARAHLAKPRTPFGYVLEESTGT